MLVSYVKSIKDNSYLFIVVLILFSISSKPVFSQDVDVSKLIEEAIKKDGSSSIGYFIVKKKAEVTYPVEVGEGSGAKEEAIEKVEVHVSEGFISNIRVYIENKVFTNPNAPISLALFRERDDILYDQEGNSVRLHSVIYYFENIDGGYLPTRFTHSDMKPGESYTIKEEDGLNSLIDFRIYSDFLGLVNEEDNGILQLESKAKFFLNPTNWFETDWIFFKDLDVFLNLSRFDDNDDFVLLEEVNTNELEVPNPIELLQKSYINLGGNLNLLSTGTMTKHLAFRINGGMGVNLSKTRKPNSEEYINLNTFSYQLQFEIEARRLENFGVNIKMGYMNLRPLDVAEINTFDPIDIWRTTAELDYFLPGQREKAFFVRFNYFDNLGSSLGNFYQLQIGYKAPLSLKSLKKGDGN